MEDERETSHTEFMRVQAIILASHAEAAESPSEAAGHRQDAQVVEAMLLPTAP